MPQRVKKPSVGLKVNAAGGGVACAPPALEEASWLIAGRDEVKMAAKSATMESTERCFTETASLSSSAKKPAEALEITREARAFQKLAGVS